jgi:GT2 family glycosyltransferase
MKLSIVIICWNDLSDIGKCLESVYRETSAIEFEVIVTDNASTDGSVPYVRSHFPQVRLVENQSNRGYGAGNNAGFRAALGEYVLILNPDTIIRGRAIEKLLAYAESHPEAGAFGCRVLNPDGSFQQAAYPIPTVRSFLMAALYLRWLGRWSDFFVSDTYVGWKGTAEREIGFQTGCCLLIRNHWLKSLGGFDEHFFHQFEDMDLCLRLWKAGSSIRYFPDAEIVHVGGRNRGRYPLRVVLETHRSRYRFFWKHYGRRGVKQIRRVSLISLWIRRMGYGVASCFKRDEAMQNRLAMYRVLITWHSRIDPVRFIEKGEEPDVGYKPLAPEAPMVAREPGAPIGKKDSPSPSLSASSASDDGMNGKV